MQCIPKECPSVMFAAYLFGKWSIYSELTYSFGYNNDLKGLQLALVLSIWCHVDHGEHICKLQLQQKNIHVWYDIRRLQTLKTILSLESHVGRAPTSWPARECRGAHVQVPKMLWRIWMVHVVIQFVLGYSQKKKKVLGSLLTFHRCVALIVVISMLNLPVQQQIGIGLFEGNKFNLPNLFHHVSLFERIQHHFPF